MYESHFNLTRKPFRLSPDIRFFYASHSHQHALAYLEYGLDQNEGFIVLTGDPGTGKTTLLNKLEESLSRQFHTARVDVTPDMNTQQLVEMIALSFGISGIHGTSEAEILVTIKNFLLSHIHLNRRAIVLVDECHHLSFETLEELRLLTNIQHRGLPLVQCFLAGQSVFKDMMRMPELEQFSQRILASCHLHPLSAKETREYIHHRLNSAGRDKENLFTRGALKIIHEFTNGNPRRINRVCDRAMLFACNEESTYINSAIICQVITELSDEMEIAFDITCYQALIEQEKHEPTPQPSEVISLREHRRAKQKYNPPAVDQTTHVMHRSHLADHSLLSHPLPVLTEAVADETKTEPQHALPSTYKHRAKLKSAASVGFILAVLPALYLAIKSPNAGNDVWQQASNHELVQPATALTKNNSPISMNEEPRDSLNTYQSVDNDNEDVTPDVSAIADSKTEIVASPPTSERFIEVEKIAVIPAVESIPIAEPALAISEPVSETSPKPVTTIEERKVVNVKFEVIPVTDTKVQKPAKPLVATKTPTQTPTAKKPEIHKKAMVSVEKPKSEPKVAIAAAPTPAVVAKTETVKKDIKKPVTQKNASKVAIAEKNVFHADNLQMVVSQFTGAYKGGDLTRLSSILSEDIKTNDSDDKATLTAQYKKLFSITDDRELKFTNVSWQTQTESAAGEGKFEAVILEKGRVKPQVFAGKFTMSIEQRNAQLAITDMRYEYHN